MAIIPPLPAVGPDYHRGLLAGRAAAKLGWAACWLPARMLAEEAVYCHYGLSPEQQGYAAALDEAYPGGEDQIAQFLSGWTAGGHPYRVNRLPNAPASPGQLATEGAAFTAENGADRAVPIGIEI